MAALFDEGTTGVLVEAVPVADLGQKREAVFADRQHLHGADVARVGALDHPRDGRHVAVLQPDPEHGVEALHPLFDLQRVFQRGTQGLFDQMRQVGLQRVAEHVDVGVVRGGDDQRVDHTRGEHIAVVGEVLHLREISAVDAAQGRLGPAQRGLYRIADGCDRGPIEQVDIADVLLSHHAGTDDAVAGRIGHGFSAPPKAQSAVKVYGVKRCPSDRPAASAQSARLPLRCLRCCYRRRCCYSCRCFTAAAPATDAASGSRGRSAG